MDAPVSPQESIAGMREVIAQSGPERSGTRSMPPPTRRSALKEAPKSMGSNGETVLRLKGERAFEVDVWTFNRRCRLL